MDLGRKGGWYPTDLGSVEMKDLIYLGGRGKWRPIEPGNQERIELGRRDTWHPTDPKNGEHRRLIDQDKKERINLGSGEKWRPTDPEIGDKRCLIDLGTRETRGLYHESSLGLMRCGLAQVGRSDDPTTSQENINATGLTSWLNPEKSWENVASRNLSYGMWRRLWMCAMIFGNAMLIMHIVLRLGFTKRRSRHYL